MDEDIILENEEESPQDSLKKLREKLRKCEEEKMEYLAGWQRAKADLINSRRDEEERRVNTIKFAEERLIHELLEFADSFDMAINNPSWESLDKNWRDGINYLYDKLKSLLRDHNIEFIESLGQKFDPELHHASGEMETEKEEEDHVVLKEERRGYKMYGKVIRPSQVKIGKLKK